jgi:hypothetical protein
VAETKQISNVNRIAAIVAIAVGFLLLVGWVVGFPW